MVSGSSFGSKVSNVEDKRTVDLRDEDVVELVCEGVVVGDAWDTSSLGTATGDCDFFLIVTHCYSTGAIATQGIN